MNLKIKIFVGVMVFLGLLSGAFLLFAKKKTATSATAQNSTTDQKANSKTNAVPMAGGLGANNIEQGAVENKKLPAKKKATPAETGASSGTQTMAEKMKSDWQLCNQGKMPAGKELVWELAISEGIPAGGTYAKGIIKDQAMMPVRIMLKAGLSSTDAEKIKVRLTAGKSTILRGACLATAPDGSASFETF